MRRHVQPGACARQPFEYGRIAAAPLAALAVLALFAAFPPAALGDWTVGAQAGVRHDDNVGNARESADIVQDSIVGARLSVFQLFPIASDYSFILGGDLSGERFHHLRGLNNGSVDASLALKRKWGWGAFVPWARAGVSVARVYYDDNYRDAWVYRATLSSGRRLDERWNVWAEYAYERRAATTTMEVEVPGISSDAYSQTGNNLALNVEYSLTEKALLSIALSARRGDVVSTTGPGYNIYAASDAIAEDPTFGPGAYAYRLTGTTYGVRVGISYSPTEHSLLGCGFQRVDTRARGGNDYGKSVPQITWDYSF